MWAVASSISVNEGAVQLLVNEGPPFSLTSSLPSSLASPSPSPAPSVQEGSFLSQGGSAILIPSLTPLAPTRLSPGGSQIFYLCI